MLCLWFSTAAVVDLNQNLALQVVEIPGCCSLLTAEVDVMSSSAIAFSSPDAANCEPIQWELVSEMM